MSWKYKKKHQKYTIIFSISIVLFAALNTTKPCFSSDSRHSDHIDTFLETEKKQTTKGCNPTQEHDLDQAIRDAIDILKQYKHSLQTPEAKPIVVTFLANCRKKIELFPPEKRVEKSVLLGLLQHKSADPNTITLNTAVYLARQALGEIHINRRKYHPRHKKDNNDKERKISLFSCGFSCSMAISYSCFLGHN
jgi:hypothetical protein